MSEEEQINNTDQNQTENDEFSDGEKNSLQEDFDQKWVATQNCYERYCCTRLCETP